MSNDLIELVVKRSFYRCYVRVYFFFRELEYFLDNNYMVVFNLLERFIDFFFNYFISFIDINIFY